MVEVLICGAGPAGTAAALWLARHGVRVLVVERATFPRRKLCGDVLSPRLMSLLGELGLSRDVEGAGLPVHGTAITCGGWSVSADYGAGGTGVALARELLDAMLARAVAAAGVQVRHGVHVVAPLLDESGHRPVVRGAVLETGAGRVRLPASVTIAADGRRSPLALALGLARHPPGMRRWAIGAYFEGVEGLGPRSELHIRPHEYLGVTPLPGGLVNAYVVSPADRAMRDPQGFLMAALSRDPELRVRFADARPVSRALSVGPLAVDVAAAGAPGLLLAGDAAGLVDPLAGDGVWLAARGGILAAAVALAMLEQPQLRGHARLAHLRAGEFGQTLRAQRLLRALLGTGAGVRTTAAVARFIPELVRRLVVVARAARGPGAGPASTRPAQS